MSIVINTSPTGEPSVQDNLWHVMSSDNSGTTDFKYVVDVWVNGVHKVRQKLFPEPTNGKGYFDAGPTVRNEMDYAWFEPINSSSYVGVPDMIGEIGIKYQLRVGEEVSGVTTINMASGDVSAYNWAPPLFKRRVITFSDKNNSWLTNRPLSGKTALGENMFIGVKVNDLVRISVDTFGYDNMPILSDDDDVSGHVRANPAIQLNIGSTAINNTIGFTVIDENVKYYDVYMFNDSNTVIPSTKFRVYLTCNPKYTCIPVHFLNRWGVWDTQRFDLASRLEMKIDRKGYGKRDYEFNDNSVDYMSSTNRYFEGKIDYSNKANWNYKLTADALTDAEYEWIADLIQSPQILLEIDGYFYPATIKQSDYEYRKFINDKLKALEVEFELNTERYTQLR